MSVFSRANDIIQSNLNAMLDKAENPQKLTSQLINEMDDAVSEARQLSASMISQKKTLTRELSSLDRKLLQWQQKAVSALEQQREDMARAALQQKYQLAQQHSALTDELRQTEEIINRLDEKIGQLKLKISQARKRARASQHVQVLSTEKRANAVSATQELLARYETKLERLESRYEHIHQADKQDNLQAQFAQLEAARDVEAQLTLLKQQRSA